MSDQAEYEGRLPHRRARASPLRAFPIQLPVAKGRRAGQTLEEKKKALGEALREARIAADDLDLWRVGSPAWEPGCQPDRPSDCEEVGL